MTTNTSTNWHPHPDAKLEKVIATAPPSDLKALLQHPLTRNDRYAHLRIIDRLHQLIPEDPAILAGWAQAMLLSNRPGPVWEVASKWPYRADSDPSWTLLAAQIAQVMGESDEARTRYRHLIETHPHMVDAWQKYLDFEDPDRLPTADIAKVEALHQSTSNSYVREKAAFALAGYHSHQSPGLAFRLASEAHQLKRKRLGSWQAGQLTQRLDMDRDRQALPAAGSSSLQPVFVVGLPRSGTTLLTRLLGSHSRISGLGEQNLIPTLAATGVLDHRNIDAQHSDFAAAWYRAAIGDLAGNATTVVDKLPANIEYAGLILSIFPDARIIHLERDLADSAMSIHLRDFEYGCLYSDDPGDLAVYASKVGAHVKYWMERVPERVLSLRYESLVDDPPTAMAPILNTLNLTWEPGMLDFWQRDEQIGTYSEGQVRRPLYKNSIGNWRRFLPEAENHLLMLGIRA